ncbi:hypothetical protein HYE68_003910 [Fusarium pseudograminearum]|nr:hypothetical protein HYE68_003910 [Fusarium pseudograminearum]
MDIDTITGDWLTTMSWSKDEAQSTHINPSDQDNANRHKDPLFFDDGDETMSEDEDFYQHMMDLEESIIRKSLISRSGIPTQESTNRPTRSTDNSKNEKEKEKDECLQRKPLSNLENCDCCPRKKTPSTHKSVHFDDDSTRVCYFYKYEQPNMIRYSPYRLGADLNRISEEEERVVRIPCKCKSRKSQHQTSSVTT